MKILKNETKTPMVGRCTICGSVIEATKDEMVDGVTYYTCPACERLKTVAFWPVESPSARMILGK